MHILPAYISLAQSSHAAQSNYKVGNNSGSMGVYNVQKVVPPAPASQWGSFNEEEFQKQNIWELASIAGTFWLMDAMNQVKPSDL